jgi:protein transport protein SEC24
MNYGRQWECLLCRTVNSSSEIYFALDGTLPDVPELTCSEFDILAPESFTSRPPMPPTYVFVVDCSAHSCSSGFLASTCESIKLLIENSALLGAPRTEVALIGFGGSVHFFNLCADSPSIIDVVGSPEDVFLPVPKDQLLVSLEDNAETLLKALDCLMKLPSQTRGNSVRSALAGATQLLHGRGGKVVLFVGHTNQADAARPKELLIAPTLKFYRDTILEMARNEISVDLFICASEYSNVSAISELARYSGGALFFYGEFMAHKHSVKLRNELWKCLTADTIWEGTMRLRTSVDWNCRSVYGNYIMKADRLACFGSTNSFKSLAFEFDLDTPIATSQMLYVQAAILHSTSDGQRLIRVINRSVSLAGEVSEIVNGIDIDVATNLLARMAVSQIIASGNLSSGRGVLESFGSNFFMQAKRAGLEGIRYFAACMMGLTKHPVFASDYLNCNSHTDNLLHDLHSYHRAITLAYGPEFSSLMAYPRLYSVHDAQPPKVRSIQSLISCSKVVTTEGVYLLDTGLEFLLWIGKL